jgi:hypothetical protein
MQIEICLPKWLYSASWLRSAPYGSSQTNTDHNNSQGSKPSRGRHRSSSLIIEEAGFDRHQDLIPASRQNTNFHEKEIYTRLKSAKSIPSMTV